MKIKSIQKIERRSPPQTPKSSSCCGPTSSCCPPSLAPQDQPSCCGPAATTRGGVITEKVPGFLCWLPTAAGRVPQISTELTFADHLGACKARWGIGRMHYIVPPGLYAIGIPDSDSPVLVTANYKMSYDILRSTLRGRNLWLLVLETFGVNVWCAAGKGTFGTDELVTQVKETGLAKVVAHRELILPILGAPGVAAHEVVRRCGFSVRYGTIRAADLPSYLDHGQVTTPAMRELTFSFYERLVLLPVEIIHALKSTLVITIALLLLGLLLGEGASTGWRLVLAYLASLFSGIVAGPLLLPWLPGRSFALKGAIIGLGCALLFVFVSGGEEWKMAHLLAAFLAIPAVSAFYTLNFTGSTTFTSPNGVKREMRLAMPAIGLALIFSAVLLVLGCWL